MEESNEISETISTVGDVMANDARALLHLDELKAYFTWANILHLFVAIVTLIIFYAVYRIIKRFVLKKATSKLAAPTAQLINKIVKYTFYVLVVMYILGLFGIDLTAIWGAAGIAGVALGFAAQTSVSNLISGMIVVAEKALQVGDFISIDGVSGTVDSIGLLSISIHTLDNQFVRIPSSSVINNNLTNFSHFPVRRFVFEFPVSYDADLSKVLEEMKKVPERCPTVISDPAPAIFYDGFGDDGVNMKFCVWFNKSDLIATKNDVYININNVCNALGIGIPYTYMNINLHNDDPDLQKIVKQHLNKGSLPNANN